MRVRFKQFLQIVVVLRITWFWDDKIHEICSLKEQDLSLIYAFCESGRFVVSFVLLFGAAFDFVPDESCRVWFFAELSHIKFSVKIVFLELAIRRSSNPSFPTFNYRIISFR